GGNAASRRETLAPGGGGIRSDTLCNMLRRAALCVGLLLTMPLPSYAAQAQAPAAGAIRVTTALDYVPTAEYAAKKDRLDVYAPAGAKGAPVVVSIHGGAL